MDPKKKKLLELLDQIANMMEEVYDENKKEYTKLEDQIMDCGSLAHHISNLVKRGEPIVPYAMVGPGTPRISFDRDYVYRTAIDLDSRENTERYRAIECKLM